MTPQSVLSLVRGWLVLAMFLAFGCMPTLAALRVERLKCEYRANPLGIDEPSPRLSWQLESGERGQK